MKDNLLPCCFQSSKISRQWVFEARSQVLTFTIRYGKVRASALSLELSASSTNIATKYSRQTSLIRPVSRQRGILDCWGIEHCQVANIIHTHPATSATVLCTITTTGHVALSIGRGQGRRVAEVVITETTTRLIKPREISIWSTYHCTEYSIPATE